MLARVAADCQQGYEGSAVEIVPTGKALNSCQTKGNILDSGMTFPLTAYIEAALEVAHYDKLEDGSFAGEIPKLKGVIAFGKTLRDCEGELRSTLEDWILAGLKFGHTLPALQ